MTHVGYPAALAMWLAMTGLMMGPVVYPWLRALGRVGAGGGAVAKGVAGGGGGPGTGGRGGAAVSGGRAAGRVAAPQAVAKAGRSAFAAGYFVAWAGFGAAAAAVHVALARLAVPVPFRLDAPLLSGAALALVGAYQFTPLKEACLSRCRSPAGFFLSSWRSGVAGRVRMGFEHGLHCVGCCWALMALALVVGMANLAWMGVLTGIMVAETALPFGARLTRPLGAGLVAAGVVVAALGGSA